MEILSPGATILTVTAERLRQAHAARGLPRPEPRRPGHHHDPHHASGTATVVGVAQVVDDDEVMLDHRRRQGAALPRLGHLDDGPRDPGRAPDEPRRRARRSSRWRASPSATSPSPSSCARRRRRCAAALGRRPAGAVDLRAASTATRASKRLFARAQRVIPGGVNSPVRAFGSVGGDAALHRARPRRARLGRRRQPLHRLRRLLGPADPRPRRPGRAARGARGGRRRARASARRRGSRSSSPSASARRCPRCEQRALRELGHRGDDERAPPRARRHRPQRASSSSRAATTATPTRCSSARAAASRRSASRARRACPQAFAELTVQAPYNDLAAVRAAFARWGAELACVIVEPVAGQHGLRAAARPASSRGCARSATGTARC